MAKTLIEIEKERALIRKSLGGQGGIKEDTAEPPYLVAQTNLLRNDVTGLAYFIPWWRFCHIGYCTDSFLLISSASTCCSLLLLNELIKSIFLQL